MKRSFSCETAEQSGYTCPIFGGDYPVIQGIIMKAAPTQQSYPPENPLKKVLAAAREVGVRPLCNEGKKLIGCQVDLFSKVIDQCPLEGFDAMILPTVHEALKKGATGLNKLCNGEFGDLEANFECFTTFELYESIEQNCGTDGLEFNRDTFDAHTACVKGKLNNYSQCGSKAARLYENVANYAIEQYEDLASVHGGPFGAIFKTFKF